jgi:hypothetical protein
MNRYTTLTDKGIMMREGKVIGTDVSVSIALSGEIKFSYEPDNIGLRIEIKRYDSSDLSYEGFIGNDINRIRSQSDNWLVIW